MGTYILSHSDGNINRKKTVLVNKKRCVKSLEPALSKQNLPCSGVQIGVRCKDRRIVGEGGTCGFVSALKRLKVGLLTLFAFQHWMPGICRKTQTN